MSEKDEIIFNKYAVCIKGKNAEILAKINLRFSVGRSSYRVILLEEKENGFIGKTNDPDVTVDISIINNSISIELVGNFSGIDTICYFTGSKIDSLYGRAFVPDEDCRIFETKAHEDFYLTNSGLLLQEKVKKNGLWMIAPPPHVFSFGDDDLGWLGLSIPEPMPVQYTNISCHNRIFNLTFDSYSPGHADGRLPTVFIDTGLDDSKAVLDCHCTHAAELGLVNMNRDDYSWWHNPIFCTWGNQLYRQKCDPVEVTDDIQIHFDEADIMHWADQVRLIYKGEFNYIIDAGWFEYIGDYKPNLSKFKSLENFKKMIADLKTRGCRVILWFTPFWVQQGANVEREHPDYLLYRLDGTVYRDKSNRAFLDYSNPDVREYARTLIEYMLVTLDADGFKIDMNYVHPLMSDITLCDPTWGYGNLFWLKVLKFFCEHTVKIKKDAFSTINGIESYLQPYACSVRLNDLFDKHNPQAWYDRAEMVLRLMPNVPIDVDGWPMDLEKAREYQFVSPVFGAPVTYHTDAVDGLSAKMTDIEFNRMASVWHVYSKAPCEYGMRVTIDAERDIFERRDGKGKLKAVALQKSVLVCYGEDSIYLTANCDRAISLPVENSNLYRNAEKVYRDGKREPVKFFRDEAVLLLNMEDSGKGILYYKIMKDLH